ncbi:thioredoxin [Solirubrum puertoriconensis]|uniref:thioredoxin n=1 Tax=Solirubrum puertoriconensis TaxID=1751427 RepID=UPI001C1F3301|nr:thioredoxin [Solirubrum puertoriconensis]
MTIPSSKSMPPPSDAAVLLVLLPVVSAKSQQHQTSLQALLDVLQGQLGSAIRVLKIDEVSHPTVVRSFHAAELPSCVLVQRGVELWRQQGLPDGDGVADELLSKLNAPFSAQAVL